MLTAVPGDKVQLAQVWPLTCSAVSVSLKTSCFLTNDFGRAFNTYCFVQLDTVTQRLIGVLGKAGPGKAADNRMYDANIACRKLAARHPMLILR